MEHCYSTANEICHDKSKSVWKFSQWYEVSLDGPVADSKTKQFYRLYFRLIISLYTIQAEKCESNSHWRKK